MPTPPFADAFAHHVWATIRLLDACADLDDAQLATTVPGTYGSILDTLRHLVDGDVFYLDVLRGGEAGVLRQGGERHPDTARRDGGPRCRSGRTWSPAISTPSTDVVEYEDSGYETHAPLGIRLAQALYHGTDHRSQVCTALDGPRHRAARDRGLGHRPRRRPDVHDRHLTVAPRARRPEPERLTRRRRAPFRPPAPDRLHSRTVTIPQDRLRNFSIIAHIDHGKSTLADRLLEMTHTIDARQMTSQVLDSMDLEREKGITIKARAVRLEYTAKDGLVYGLNLIDTPGHVDFAYEVSHSLQACEGAILVVDATQGIEAQTLANVHLAMREDLTIIPVLNKIDLPSADPETSSRSSRTSWPSRARRSSSPRPRTGTGVPEILEAIVARIPPPKGDPTSPLQGLIFDSHYDAYKGVIAYVRLAQGTLRDGEPIRLMASGAEAEPLELGVFRPQLVPVKQLVAGEVGYVATGLKNVREAQVGDTVTTSTRPAADAAARLPAGQEPRVRRALPGQRRGLPAPARRAREAPPQRRELHLRAGELGRARVRVPLRVPRPAPHGDRPGAARARVRPRPHRLGAVGRVPRDPDERARRGRGRQPGAPADPATSRTSRSRGSSSASSRRRLHRAADGALDEPARHVREHGVPRPDSVVLHFEMPLAELIVDYYDQLKSRTQGYASMDYEELGYRAANLVKLDILVNGEPVDALSLIVHRDRAAVHRAPLAERLKELIPRQMFEVPIQAAIGSNVVARETVRAMRKNVLAKCYGGDITRKRKLLEKQKEGKQRMKRVGSVEIPQEAFLAMLRMGEG